MNASWQRRRDPCLAITVHVGLAIDTRARAHGAGGCGTPHALGIGGIASEIRRLAEAARGGHLHPAGPPGSHDRREQHRQLRHRGRHARC